MFTLKMYDKIPDLFGVASTTERVVPIKKKFELQCYLRA
jgi:hypothetical protein